MVRFGPAGQDDEFAREHKSSLHMPAYLAARGLSAFEYQCGHGVRVTEKTARALGEEAVINNVALSVHAPYYISMASAEEEKRIASVEYLFQAARAADWMGGTRVVFHPGGAGRLERKDAMALATVTTRLALRRLEEAGLGHIILCPETMGKRNQLGSVEEILALCARDERLLPCIDFGHLYARSGGTFQGEEAMAALLDQLRDKLGEERGRRFHAHFSRIEFTPAGGERRHLTFDDAAFGPDFAPLARLLAERRLEPVIICESSGTQTRDALIMKELTDKETARVSDH